MLNHSIREAKNTGEVMVQKQPLEHQEQRIWTKYLPNSDNQTEMPISGEIKDAISVNHYVVLLVLVQNKLYAHAANQISGKDLQLNSPTLAVCPNTVLQASFVRSYVTNACLTIETI